MDFGGKQISNISNYNIWFGANIHYEVNMNRYMHIIIIKCHTKRQIRKIYKCKRIYLEIMIPGSFLGQRRCRRTRAFLPLGGWVPHGLRPAETNARVLGLRFLAELDCEPQEN